MYSSTGCKHERCKSMLQVTNWTITSNRSEVQVKTIIYTEPPEGNISFPSVPSLKYLRPFFTLNFIFYHYVTGIGKFICPCLDKLSFQPWKTFLHLAGTQEFRTMSTAKNSGQNITNLAKASEFYGAFQGQSCSIAKGCCYDSQRKTIFVQRLRKKPVSR